MLSRWPWDGRFVITVRRSGIVVARYDIKNTTTTVGKNLFSSALLGMDTMVRYVALGTSSTAPSSGQTQLIAESFRKYISQQAAGGTGEAITTFYIAPNEANIAIQEIGIFAGPTATATANSGVMLARTLWAHTKTSGESVQIDRHDTLS